MKITITGSLGNISKPLAEILVKNGHEITIISNDTKKIKDIEALCEALSESAFDSFQRGNVFTDSELEYYFKTLKIFVKLTCKQRLGT